MKNHISTFSYLMLKYFVFVFLTGFLVFNSKGQSKPVKKKQTVLEVEKKNSQNDYVLIPDMNFEKALINLKIDSIQDGKVLRNNVLKTKVLKINYFESIGSDRCSFDPISSLSGIEEFINLEELNLASLK
jgi:hypothetical protein